jgi:hypothetical protein
MSNKRNLKQFQVYLRPKQIESLNNLRSQIKIESEVKFPVSELIRDAVDQFILKTVDEQVRKNYIENKGW